MVNRIELLVHAGAPSSRKDDDRYRAQAEAYLGFKGQVLPLQRAAGQIDQQSGPEQQHSVNHSDVLSRSDRDATTIVNDDTTVFLDDTQLAYNALDSQLLTSSFAPPLESTPIRTEAAQPTVDSQVILAEAPDLPEAPRATRSPSTSSPLLNHGKGKRRLSDGAFDRLSSAKRTRDAPEPDKWNDVISDEVPAQREASQSSYLKTPVLNRSKKRRLGDQFQQPLNNEDTRLPPYIPLQEGSHVGLAYIGGQPDAQGAVKQGQSQNDSGGNQSTSELPTSYSLSDITSESSRAKAKASISQRSASDPGPQLGSISPTALKAVPTPRKFGNESIRHASQRSASEPAVADATRVSHTNVVSALTPSEPLPRSQPVAPLATSPQQSRSDSLNNIEKPAKCATQLSVSDEPDPAVAELASLSISIRPPGPSTTTDKFKTHVTEPLNFLAETSDVAKSYKPVSVARDLRPSERGYWLVDCSTWPLQPQIDLWRFLEKFISNGNSGWGVWCTRGDGEEMQQAASTSTFGAVKVFCWGETVKHIYLVLYVASKSQVRKLGLQWIDAEGQVIVQMRAG